MKQQITLDPIKTNITADCFGCDHLRPIDHVIKRGFLGIGQKTERKHYCSVLLKGNAELELTDYQINATNLTAEECPCHFLNWKQNHAELDETVTIPVYHFRVEAGKIVWITEAVNDYLTRISDGKSLVDDKKVSE